MSTQADSTHAAQGALAPQTISTDVLLEKYAKAGEGSIEDVFVRVARGLAQAEAPEQQAHYAEAFYRNMLAGAIGAGRIMSAAGTDIRATLINCFVQPVGDCIQGEDEAGYPGIYEALKQAAWEETEHLAWTERRIAELGGHKSVFNPVWYAGSLAMGVTAGLLGDKWNLGFLEETEYQVEAHLNEHLASLPAQDEKSRAILTQMREDEVKHAEMAHSYGAAALPAPIKGIMHITAKLMKQASYRI